MGSKRIGLARTQALIENLKRDLDISQSTLSGLQAQKKAEDPTYGAGLISTEVAPATYVSKLANGDIVTTIDIDLTGLKKASDVGDVIGLDGVAGAYALQYATATHGILYRVELTCLELPTGTNVLKDFDLILHSSSTLAYDGDASGGESIFAATENIAKGQTMTNETVGTVTSGNYLYLCEGATSTGAAVFTAGKLTVRLYGRASF